MAGVGTALVVLLLVVAIPVVHRGSYRNKTTWKCRRITSRGPTGTPGRGTCGARGGQRPHLATYVESVAYKIKKTSTGTNGNYSRKIASIVSQNANHLAGSGLQGTIVAYNPLTQDGDFTSSATRLEDGQRWFRSEKVYQTGDPLPRPEFAITFQPTSSGLPGTHFQEVSQGQTTIAPTSSEVVNTSQEVVSTDRKFVSGLEIDLWMHLDLLPTSFRCRTGSGGWSAMVPVREGVPDRRPPPRPEFAITFQPTSSGLPGTHFQEVSQGQTTIATTSSEVVNTSQEVVSTDWKVVSGLEVDRWMHLDVASQPPPNLLLVSHKVKQSTHVKGVTIYRKPSSAHARHTGDENGNHRFQQS